MGMVMMRSIKNNLRRKDYIGKILQQKCVRIKLGFCRYAHNKCPEKMILLIDTQTDFTRNWHYFKYSFNLALHAKNNRRRWLQGIKL